MSRDLTQGANGLADYLEQGVNDWSIVNQLLLEHGDQYYFSIRLEGFAGDDRRAWREAEEKMRAAGFDQLGDLYCTRFNDGFVRGFVSPDRRCFGLLRIGADGSVDREFFSLFEDGSCLTTTTRRAVPQWPEHGIVYQQVSSETTTVELIDLHASAVEEQQAHVGHSLLQKPTLHALAYTLDAMLTRMTPEILA